MGTCKAALGCPLQALFVLPEQVPGPVLLPVPGLGLCGRWGCPSWDGSTPRPPSAPGSIAHLSLHSPSAPSYFQRNGDWKRSLAPK